MHIFLYYFLFFFTEKRYNERHMEELLRRPKNGIDSLETV